MLASVTVSKLWANESSMPSTPTVFDLEVDVCPSAGPELRVLVHSCSGVESCAPCASAESSHVGVLGFAVAGSSVDNISASKLLSACHSR